MLLPPRTTALHCNTPSPDRPLDRPLDVWTLYCWIKTGLNVVRTVYPLLVSCGGARGRHRGRDSGPDYYSGSCAAAYCARSPGAPPRAVLSTCRYRAALLRTFFERARMSRRAFAARDHHLCAFPGCSGEHMRRSRGVDGIGLTRVVDARFGGWLHYACNLTAGHTMVTVR